LKRPAARREGEKGDGEQAMKRKLSLLISEPLVWLLDHLPCRRLTQNEIAQARQFAGLMADADVNRIVREKPVDYMGFGELLMRKPQTKVVQ
jgi:hypothetical protein